MSDTEWANTTMGAYGIYTYGDIEGIDSDEQMVDAYGKLYNWYAVDDGRGLCPSGWHVPSEEEWTAMENYLIYSLGYTNEFDDPEAIGNVLKAARQVGHEWGGEHDTEEHPRWKYAISETSTGMDVFGFSLFPAGRRHYNGGFFDLGSQAQLWLSTENTPEFSEVRTVLTSLGFISKSGYLKGNGYSVRCIKSSN